MNWHPDGQLFATISKDTKIRIYDPRKSSEPIQVSLLFVVLIYQRGILVARVLVHCAGGQ